MALPPLALDDPFLLARKYHERRVLAQRLHDLEIEVAALERAAILRPKHCNTDKINQQED